MAAIAQRRPLVSLLAAATIAAAAACWWFLAAAPVASDPAAAKLNPDAQTGVSAAQSVDSDARVTASTAPAAFVGRAACAGCHAAEDRLWQGSHHDLAMQEATDLTVLGDFADRDFEKDSVVSRFFRRDGRFMVRTDGPDGGLADFEVKYTFGVAPLQQYLVELPGGRLQALPMAWDSRPKDEGGGRWFHLHPGEKIDHDDELHWTGASQNWNFMCAECHSTNVQKNYDAGSRTYRTTWSEIDVACEACHGPGSRHVAFEQKAGGSGAVDSANRGLVLSLSERRDVRWPIDPQSGNARRSSPRQTETEIQTCARCHARRAQLFGDYRYRELMDSHLPSLLEDPLYHADGQVDGEVYEYGSFIQSRMFDAGVTCGDCHDPHSLALRAPGNGVCLQCHSAAKYDAATHHFHAAGAAGSHCVDCHMPVTSYMLVDPRHDHSLRIPRPDQSAKIGTPNACNGCHRERSADWAADQVRRWYGHDPSGHQQYAETLAAARVASGDTEAKLVALLENREQPAIARATAAAALGPLLTSASLPALVAALGDADPRVRAAAVEALDALPPDQRWSIANQLLRDPVRVVRALAAGALAGVAAGQLPDADRAALESATQEYIEAQRLNADEPAAQVNLGNFFTARGQNAEAETAYREALALNPSWVAAYVNLADLFRQTGRDGDGETLLREGLARVPDSAALHHSLGLLQIRRKDVTAALVSLKRAAELAPDDARFVYVYAVALDGDGKSDDARAIVDQALERMPSDRSLVELRSQLSPAAQ